MGRKTPTWDKGIDCNNFTVLSNPENSRALLFLPKSLVKWALVCSGTPGPLSHNNLNFKNIPGLEARI